MGNKQKARPVVTDVSAVQIGGGQATPDNTVVSRSFAEVVDLISEGTIEGITSGKYTLMGKQGETGYQEVEFSHYAATGVLGKPFPDTAAALLQRQDLGFLQSVYWNDIPVVDAGGFYNFPSVNLQYVKGNPAGNIPFLNSDMSTYAGISATEELDLTVHRSIGERLYGPEIKGGDDSPTDKKHAQLKQGVPIDKYAKTYTILNKEVSTIEVNIKVSALVENVQAGPKTYHKKRPGQLKRYGRAAVGYGDSKARTIEYQIYYRPMFDQRFSDTSVKQGVIIKEKTSQPFETWKLGKSENITGKIDTPYIRRSIIPLTGKNYQDQEGFEGWEIRILRSTPESLTSFLRNSSFVDSIVEVYGTRLRYPYSSMVYSQFDARSFTRIPSRAYDARLIKVKVPNNYDPITKTYGRSDGTDQSTRTGSPDWTPADAPTKKIDCATVTNSFWDGEFKKDADTYSAAPKGAYLREWTDNPAWCFYDLMSNPRYGLGEFIEENQIDKWTLYEIAQYCDELVPDTYGSLEPNFTINYLINSREEAFKVLNDLTSIFRGISYYSNGSIYAVQDKYRKAIYQFNNSNVIDGNFTYQSSSQKARHTVAIVRYNDKKNLYQPALEYLENEEGVRRYGIREIETTALGCTSRGQARRFAKWVLASEFNETETVSFSVGQDGAFLMPGDVIQIYDNFRSPLKHSGRTNAVRPLILDENVGNQNVAKPNDWDSDSFNSIILDQGLNFTSNKLYKFSLLTPTYNTTTGDASDIRRGQLQNLLFSGAHTNSITGDYRSDFMESGSGVCTQIYFNTGNFFNPTGIGGGIIIGGGTGNKLDFDNYVITGYTNTGVNTDGSSDTVASYSGGCYSGENLIWSVEPNDPNDTEFISGNYSNFKIINIKEEEQAYGISALAYSTGKYAEVTGSAGLSSAETTNQPLFPTGETKPSTNITELPGNTKDEINSIFSVTQGQPFDADNPTKDSSYKTIEIEFSQAGFEVEGNTPNFNVINPIGSSGGQDKESSDKEIYDIDYTIGITLDDLGETPTSRDKYGLPAAGILDNNIVYIVPPNKFKEYKSFTKGLINYSDPEHTLGDVPADSKIFAEYLVTNTEELETDTKNYWVSLFATSITNDVSYGMVVKISVDGLLSAFNSVVGSSKITNLTTNEISTTSELDLHPINDPSPAFNWHFSAGSLVNTNPTDTSIPNFSLPFPDNTVDYRITLRKPKSASDTENPNEPTSHIYVEVTGYGVPNLTPSFVVSPAFVDPNQIVEYRTDAHVTGWKDGSLVNGWDIRTTNATYATIPDQYKEDNKYPTINPNPGYEDFVKDGAIADWLSVSGSGFNVRNNESSFPPRKYDIVVETHDKDGQTSTNNRVFANTIKATVNGESQYDTETYQNYTFATNTPSSYDILGVEIPSPTGIIFMQVGQDKYRTELNTYSFIDSNTAWTKKFPYVSKAAVYPNGYLEIGTSLAENYDGESYYTEQEVENFFQSAEGIVYYYSTGDNTTDYEGDQVVPLNLAPSFTLNLDATSVQSYLNTGRSSAVDAQGFAFGGIIQTEVGYAGRIHRRFKLLAEDDDPLNLRIPFPHIGTSTVANIELAFGFFDELSLNSSFDDDAPKKYSVTNPDTSQTYADTPKIYKDFNINFSRSAEPEKVSYDNITAVGNGAFLSPSSLPLNESSMMSKNAQSKAWAGWGHIVLDFEGLDLIGPMEKLGFICNNRNAPFVDSNWTFPAGADNPKYGQDLASYGNVNYYEKNCGYYDETLLEPYYTNLSDVFNVKILQDVNLQVDLRVFPTFSYSEPGEYGGMNPLDQYSIRPSWNIQPTIKIISPAGEPDKTVVMDLWGHGEGDRNNSSGAVTRREGFSRRSTFKLKIEEDGRMTLYNNSWMVFESSSFAGTTENGGDNSGNAWTSWIRKGNSMLNFFQNTVAAGGILTRGYLEDTLGTDGVDYSLIAPTQALVPIAYSFGILQKE